MFNYSLVFNPLKIDGTRHIMRLSFLNIFFAAIILFSCTLLVSCDKVNVSFGNLNQNIGPSITFLQDNKVVVQTLQVDSFLTSSKNTFLIGYNNDPALGTIHASSYAQFLLPANPILNVQHLTFDSIVLRIKSKANYDGDTTRPFAIRVYPLTQQIQNAALTNNDYYSTTSFSHATSPINYYANDYIIDSPGTASFKTIRLQDSLGQSLLNDFITGNPTILTQTIFTDYFPGIYLDVDTNTIKTNTVYSFNDTLTLRLYYDQHGLNTVTKFIDFNYNSAKQFNHIDYNPGSIMPAFPAFINNSAVLNSTVTNDKGYLSSSTGTIIKISFPDLANLKALYPFIQVVSAQLIVPPTRGTYVYPYKLPPALTLYETSNTNAFLGAAITPTGGTQNGNLFIDNLYGISTEYTYDVTSFITAQLNPPPTLNALTPNALLLSPSATYGDETLSRLIINDQNLTPGIQLKLYVLGI